MGFEQKLRWVPSTCYSFPVNIVCSGNLCIWNFKVLRYVSKVLQVLTMYLQLSMINNCLRDRIWPLIWSHVLLFSTKICRSEMSNNGNTDFELDSLLVASNEGKGGKKYDRSTGGMQAHPVSSGPWLCSRNWQDRVCWSKKVFTQLSRPYNF